MSTPSSSSSSARRARSRRAGERKTSVAASQSSAPAVSTIASSGSPAGAVPKAAAKKRKLDDDSVGQTEDAKKNKTSSAAATHKMDTTEDKAAAVADPHAQDSQSQSAPKPKKLRGDKLFIASVWASLPASAGEDSKAQAAAPAQSKDKTEQETKAKATAKEKEHDADMPKLDDSDDDDSDDDDDDTDAKEETKTKQPKRPKSRSPLDVDLKSEEGQQLMKHFIDKCRVPDFFPSCEEWKDGPYSYLELIRKTAEKYGIIKVIPPKGEQGFQYSHRFPFLDPKYRFLLKRQRVQSVGTKTKLSAQFEFKAANKKATYADVVEGNRNTFTAYLRHRRDLEASDTRLKPLTNEDFKNPKVLIEEYFSFLVSSEREPQMSLYASDVSGTSFYRRTTEQPPSLNADSSVNMGSEPFGRDPRHRDSVPPPESASFAVAGHGTMLPKPPPPITPLPPSTPISSLTADELFAGQSAEHAPTSGYATATQQSTLESSASTEKGAVNKKGPPTEEKKSKKSSAQKPHQLSDSKDEDMEIKECEADAKASGDLSFWQPNRLARDPWGMLRDELIGGRQVPGVTEPMTYMGMLFSTFAWHREDNFLYSTSLIVKGASKFWFGVPGEEAEKVEKLARKLFPELAHDKQLLAKKTTMIHPIVMLKYGIKVYWTEQKEGEFMFTYPSGFHGGFSAGLSTAESVNFATADWLKEGAKSVEHNALARKQSVVPFEELVWWAVLELLECEARLKKPSVESKLPFTAGPVRSASQMAEYTNAVLREFTAIVEDHERRRKEVIKIRGDVHPKATAIDTTVWGTEECSTCLRPCYVSFVVCKCGMKDPTTTSACIMCLRCATEGHDGKPALVCKCHKGKNVPTMTLLHRKNDLINLAQLKVLAKWMDGSKKGIEFASQIAGQMALRPLLEDVATTISKDIHNIEAKARAADSDGDGDSDGCAKRSTRAAPKAARSMGRVNSKR